MAINKVVYGGNTLIDLTSDSVTPETLAAGMTATAANGEKIVGLMPTITEEYLQNVVSTAQSASDKVNDLEERMDNGEFKGEDGFSPLVEITEIVDPKRQTITGNTVNITDKEGTKTFNVMNGAEIIDMSMSEGSNYYSIHITLSNNTAYSFAIAKPVNGAAGKDGEDGHTPEKGVDYYTEEDKNEIVSDVLNSLPYGDEVSY